MSEAVPVGYLSILDIARGSKLGLSPGRALPLGDRETEKLLAVTWDRSDEIRVYWDFKFVFLSNLFAKF